MMDVSGEAMEIPVIHLLRPKMIMDVGTGLVRTRTLADEQGTLKYRLLEINEV